MHSIKAKFIVIVLLVTVLPLAILGFLDYRNSEKIVIRNAEESLSALSVNNAEKIGSWLDIRKGEIVVLANSPVVTGGDANSIVAYLASESKRNNVYLRFLVADLSGNTYYTNGAKANIADRPYFQQAKAGKVVISDPVVSKNDGKTVFVVAAPIIKDGAITAVLGGTVTVDDMNKRVLEVKVGQSGYAFVNQGDGLTIFHPSPDVVMKSNNLKDNVDPALKTMTEKMGSGEKGLMQYTYNNVTKYAAYAPIPGTAWSMGVNAPVNEVTAQLNQLIWSSLTTTLITLIIIIFAAVLFANRFTNPIRKLHAIAERVAQGDLTVTGTTIASKDEIGHLATVLSNMVVNLRNLVLSIQENAGNLAAAAGQLSASAEQAASANNQVITSITEMAQGTENQATAITGTSAAVTDISSSISRVAGDADLAAKVSENAITTSRKGTAAVESAVSQMSIIEKTVNHSAEKVAKLGERSQEIGQIVETISGIAGQTNLLALNAAIEAARAGEQGRGFAVVAEEVRKLAEQSQQAAGQIAELIKEIQQDTDEAVVGMNAGTREVKIGAEVVNTAGQAFNEIANLINDVSTRIQAITAAMGEVAGGSSKISASVQSIKAISEDNAGQTQTVSAATEEQSASMQEIASSSEALTKMAQTLQDMVKRFKV